MRILLGSGGLSTEARRAAWRGELDRFLGPVGRVLFVPYAVKDHGRVLARMGELDLWAGREAVGLHQAPDPRAAVATAPALLVGGGNTFLLLRTLQRLGLLAPIRARVSAGMPYVGISAGTNVACPTICTTNDMPVVAPRSLKALGLVPFQVNPHYFSGPIHIATPGGFVPYGGETRDDRLREFHEWNRTPVVAPWEGGWLVQEDGPTRVGGAPARLFRRGQPALDLEPGATLEPHLAPPARRGRAGSP